MITIKLGKVSKSGSNSTARMTESIEISCVLKNATSINTPTFIINGEPTDANQLIWNDVYYDITNVTIINNEHYSIECVKNALATYKNEIEEKAHFFDVISSNNTVPSRLSSDGFASDFDRPSEFDVLSYSNKIGIDIISEDVSYIIQTSTIKNSYFVCDSAALNYILGKFVYDTETSLWEAMGPSDIKSIIVVPFSFLVISGTVTDKKSTGVISYTNNLGNQTLTVGAGNIFEMNPGVYALKEITITKEQFNLGEFDNQTPWIIASSSYSSYYITIFGQVFQIPNYFFTANFTLKISMYYDIASFNICAVITIDDYLIGTTEAMPIGGFSVQNYNALQAYSYQFSKISQLVSSVSALPAAYSSGSFAGALESASDVISKRLIIGGSFGPPICEARSSNLSNYEVIKNIYTTSTVRKNVKVNKIGVSANTKTSITLNVMPSGFYRAIETINFNALSEDINAVNSALLSGFYYE